MNDFCFSKQVAPYDIFRIDKHEGSTVTPVPREGSVAELTQAMIERGSLHSDKGKVRIMSFLFVLYL